MSSPSTQALSIRPTHLHDTLDSERESLVSLRQLHRVYACPIQRTCLPCRFPMVFASTPLPTPHHRPHASAGHRIQRTMRVCPTERVSLR
jgi:hypothetical protein